MHKKIIRINLKFLCAYYEIGFSDFPVLWAYCFIIVTETHIKNLSGSKFLKRKVFSNLNQLQNNAT